MFVIIQYKMNKKVLARVFMLKTGGDKTEIDYKAISNEDPTRLAGLLCSLPNCKND